MRRITALILAAIMCLSFMTEAAFATDAEPQVNGEVVGTGEIPTETGGDGTPITEVPPVQTVTPAPTSTPAPISTPTPATTPTPEPTQTPSNDPTPAPTESSAPESDTEKEGSAGNEGASGTQEGTAEKFSVRFNLTPADLTLKVYASDSLPISSEADGSYLLLPGTYYYDAEREGYISALGVPFTVAGNAAIEVVLEQDSASSLQGEQSDKDKTDENEETFTAVFEDNTGSGFEFALTGKTDNTYKAGETLSFGFTGDDEKNADKDLYENFTWTVTMKNAEATIALFVGANEDNSLFTLYSDEAKTTPAAATGDAHIVLTGKTAKPLTVTVINDTGNPIVFLLSDTADIEKDYVFYVAHPQDEASAAGEGEAAPDEGKTSEETPQSDVIYSLPIIKIKGAEFYGYTFKKMIDSRTLGEKTYTCYWEFTIPGKHVKGDIIIDANKHSITETKHTVDMTQVAGSLVPYSENEKMLGTSVTDTNGKQTYYFYFNRTPNTPHPIYSVNNVKYSLTPLTYGKNSEESNVYKISDITGDVTVSLGYNITKLGSGNNEEALIELQTNTAVQPGEKYTFKVRTHDMTESELQIFISMGGAMLEADDVNLVRTIAEDELGKYVEYSVSTVTGDIIVQAQSAKPVQCRVKFADAYNSNTTLKYSAFDYTSTVVSNYSSQTHIGEVAYKGTNLTFTILNSPLYKKSDGTFNVDGSSSDPNTGCYNYEVTATMGGKAVAVTWYNGQYYVNNGGAITGDVLIKTNLTLSSYECAVNGAEKVTITNRETFINSAWKTAYTGRRSDRPKYRYLFTVTANPALTQKIYIRQYNGSTTTKRTFNISDTKTTAMIYGDLIQSNIAVTALGADEVEVYVTGSKAANINFDSALHNYSFYHGGIAKKGADFTFTVSPATKITIKSGGSTLTLGKQYTAAYDETANAYVYKIPAAYMTADIQIGAYSNYNVSYTGTGAKYAKPLNNPYTEKDSVVAGNDYVFTLPEGTVTIKTGATVNSNGKVSGGVTLKKDKDYTVSGETYTISAKSIVGDLVISVTAKKSSGRSGGYTSRTYGDVELDIGSELFMTLDNKKTMYLVVVYGEPEDGRHVCFNNRKMIRSDAYDAYVWLEISDMDYDEFEEYALDKVDLLYEREMRENLEKENPDEKIEILPMEEIHNLNEDYEVICDVNEDGAVDEEDLKLMRQMFAGTFEDFDEISMRSFICADVDMSFGLDMLDAAMIKYNFDKDEDEDENEDEEEQEQNEEN